MNARRFIALDTHMQALHLSISWLETGKARKYNEEIKTLDDMIEISNRIKRCCKKMKDEINER